MIFSRGKKMEGEGMSHDNKVLTQSLAESEKSATVSPTGEARTDDENGVKERRVQRENAISWLFAVQGDAITPEKLGGMKQREASQYFAKVLFRLDDWRKRLSEEIGQAEGFVSKRIGDWGIDLFPDKIMVFLRNDSAKRSNLHLNLSNANGKQRYFRVTLMSLCPARQNDSSYNEGELEFSIVGNVVNKEDGKTTDWDKSVVYIASKDKFARKERNSGQNTFARADILAVVQEFGRYMWELQQERESQGSRI